MVDKEIKPVICPYCCHKFHPNEADFRLNAAVAAEKPKTKGRKKAAQNLDAGKVQDPKLYAYNLEILQNDEVQSAKNAMQYLPINLVTCPSLEYSENDLTKYGFAQRITYTTPEGVRLSTEKRLCPNCHNDLPTGYGLRDTVLISVIGDARSGKSIYLTMLIEELENNPDFVSKLTFIGDKSVKESFYKHYQKPLLKDHTLVSSTKRKKIPPFAYNYWYQYKNEEGTLVEKTIDLIFYDIAGEDMRDESAIRQNGFNIRDSSGLIFLADPTNFKRMSDLFRFSDNALIEAIPADNSNLSIFNTLFNFFLGLEKEKCSIPFALAVSKSDLFRYVNFNFFDNKPENRIQNLFEDESHKAALNMRCIRGINYEVRELLNYLDEDYILNNAQGCFKSVSCFAVSSLGKKPTVEQISDPETNETLEKGYIDGALEPFRVKEPFYWILMKNQLLYQYENGRYTPNGYKPAEMEPTSLWDQFMAWLAKLLHKN